MTVQSEVYPFATMEGQAIPLDILRPSSFMLCNFTTAPAELTADAEKIAVFLASADCLVVFGAAAPAGTLVSGTHYADALFVPANNFVVSAVTASAMSVRGLTVSGTLYVQFIEKWSGLSVERAYTRK